MTDFERLVVGALKQLYTYALHLTHDADQANDLLQSTILRILTNKHNYTNHNSFDAWARVIMRHIFLNDERRENNHDRAVVTGYDDVENSPAVAADNAEDYGEVLSAINTLPEEQAVLLAKRAEGYKYEEIARELKLPVGTVKSRIFEAKKMLKKRLEG